MTEMNRGVTPDIHIGKNGPEQCPAKIKCRLEDENGNPDQHFFSMEEAHKEHLKREQGDNPVIPEPIGGVRGRQDPSTSGELDAKIANLKDRMRDAKRIKAEYEHLIDLELRSGSSRGSREVTSLIKGVETVNKEIRTLRKELDLVSEARQGAQAKADPVAVDYDESIATVDAEIRSLKDRLKLAQRFKDEHARLISMESSVRGGRPSKTLVILDGNTPRVDKLIGELTKDLSRAAESREKLMKSHKA
ncbi:hypothetical protein E6Q11_06545 [Candidatus Dojkabacteria bacterium]|uniref:Uncharacterized protein n=1 Tax=Candidatus Dojkabacteria bacterium TaxID=2099670 RepID=A0A5C7J2S7_9BACT|nr:MAG: hypothetical protein E6Q11_06545 [Candidatus Dojkabacteria bacterium]